jgi:chitodextrinase
VYDLNARLLTVPVVTCLERAWTKAGRGQHLGGLEHSQRHDQRHDGAVRARNLAAQAVSSTQVNLSWSASTDNVSVTGYKVFRDGTLVTTTPGTSYQDTGRAASTTYSYTVLARDAVGNESAQSSAVTATTPAPDTSPPGASITAPAAGSVVSGVSTLTTTSVSDPDLVLQDGWLKVFTVLYQLIAIGILVEVLRRLGIAFITVRAEEKRASRSGAAPGSA